MNTLDYEDYEKFKDATLPHFVKGISAILSFANSAAMLGDRDLDEPQCKKVKRDIGLAFEEMSVAEKNAKGMIDSLTAKTLQLTKDIDKARVDRKSLTESLLLKKDELISLENRRYQVNDQLQAARSSLQHTENALNTAESRQGEKVTGRDVGIGLMLLIPCVGIPMTVDYNKELKSTKRLVKTVEGEVHRLRAVVKQNEEEMSRLNSEIPEKGKGIERVKESLGQRERELESMQRAYTALADIKCKLKYCCNYLDSLHGDVEVLYNSCKDLYSLEPIMPVIEATFKTVQQQNSHNELLTHDPQVQKIVRELKKIESRMNMK